MTSSLPLSPPPPPHHLSLSFNTGPPHLALLPLPSKTSLLLSHTRQRKLSPKTKRGWSTVSAVADDALPSDITTTTAAATTTSAIETTQQMVSTNGDDGVSTVISVLLFTAFIGLSVLSIGVIYIAVTDFLQKREREQFEKQEAAKKKKRGKKVKARARAGPRGFGQKTDEDDDDNDA